MILPSRYTPLSPDEFIGNGPEGARSVAGFLQRAVAVARSNNNSPLAFLLSGDPGLGKSALARYLAHLLGVDKFSTFKFNGTQFRVEVVDDLANQLHYKTLFGDYRFIWIDEADEIPRVAQVRFLSLLDELPNGVAVICTSNSKLKNFDERFQSRFQYFEIKSPDAHEIESLLLKFNADPAIAKNISLFACGNVRQALFDLQGALQNAA